MCSVEKRSRKPRDSISHVAPRPVIFPTADRRRKPSLCRGKERIASLVWRLHRLKRAASAGVQPLHLLASRRASCFGRKIACTSHFFLFSFVLFIVLFFFFFKPIYEPERDLVTFPVSQLPQQVAASPGTAAYVLFEPRRLTPALSSRARC